MLTALLTLAVAATDGGTLADRLEAQITAGVTRAERCTALLSVEPVPKSALRLIVFTDCEFQEDSCADRGIITVAALIDASDTIIAREELAYGQQNGSRHYERVGDSFVVTTEATAAYDLGSREFWHSRDRFTLTATAQGFVKKVIFDHTEDDFSWRFVDAQTGEVLVLDAVVITESDVVRFTPQVQYSSRRPSLRKLELISARTGPFELVVRFRDGNRYALTLDGARDVLTSRNVETGEAQQFTRSESKQP